MNEYTNSDISIEWNAVQKNKKRIVDICENMNEYYAE